MSDKPHDVGRKNTILEQIQEDRERMVDEALKPVLRINAALTTENDRLRAQVTQIQTDASAAVEKWQEECQDHRRTKSSREVWQRAYTTLAEEHGHDPMQKLETHDHRQTDRVRGPGLLR